MPRDRSRSAVTPILLNEQLDPAPLREAYLRDGRVRIHNAFKPDAAQAIHQCLSRDVPWRLSFWDYDRPERERLVVMTREEFGRLTPQESALLSRKINQQAQDRFQFLYNSYMLIDAFERRLDPGLFIHHVLAYLGSDHFFDFARQVTGAHDIERVDAHATRFLPGHFLTEHADPHPTQIRRVAYVASFTPMWKPDWGGLLQFHDESGRGVSATLVPDFNSLTLFRVPVSHSVSYVAPFARGQRLSITGWLIA